MNQLTQQTMTIKQLAEVAGCSVITVRRTIKESFPRLTKKGKVTRICKEDAFDIMAKLPKRNNLDHNFDQKSKVAQADIDRIKSDISQLETNFNEFLRVFRTYVESQTKLEPKPEPKFLAPKLEPKDEIRRIINSYTAHVKNEYRDNWNLLYQECYYRLGKNFRTLAHNRQMKPLELIVEEGFAPDVLLIARDLFQLGRQ